MPETVIVNAGSDTSEPAADERVRDSDNIATVGEVVATELVEAETAAAVEIAAIAADRDVKIAEIEATSDDEKTAELEDDVQWLEDRIGALETTLVSALSEIRATQTQLAETIQSILPSIQTRLLNTPELAEAEATSATEATEAAALASDADGRSESPVVREAEAATEVVRRARRKWL